MNNEIDEEQLQVMHKILNKEVIAKEENNRLYNVKVAAFSFLRKVDDYDFNFQPGIKEEKIRSIIESDFYENATNVVFIGNPGTGKTHLAIAIAYTVAIRRNSVYFIKFNKLINILRQANFKSYNFVVHQWISLHWHEEMMCLYPNGFHCF